MTQRKMPTRWLLLWQPPLPKPKQRLWQQSHQAMRLHPRLPLPLHPPRPLLHPRRHKVLARGRMLWLATPPPPLPWMHPLPSLPWSVQRSLRACVRVPTAPDTFPVATPRSKFMGYRCGVCFNRPTTQEFADAQEDTAASTAASRVCGCAPAVSSPSSRYLVWLLLSVCTDGCRCRAVCSGCGTVWYQVPVCEAAARSSEL